MRVSHQWTLLNAITLAIVVIAHVKYSASVELGAPKDFLDRTFNIGQLPSGEKIHPIDYLLQDFLPPIYGQRPNNENGTRPEFKEYALTDTSNDDAMFLSGQELITRSGFKYEMFDAVADDGYITTLTRLINPLADRTKLRQPPLLMEHGGTIDPTAYLIASSIQHFPEKWPRGPEDGPIRSWNRSLAFVLANHGFDVWLAETRGANDANNRRLKYKPLKSFVQGKNDEKNLTLGENIRSIIDAWDFWSFSQDDIIAHEFKSHIDTVLNVTNSKKLHLFTFSLSTPTSLAFLGSRPDYAERIEGFVSMAPIVSGQGVNKVVKFGLETICPIFPDALGTLLFTDTFLTPPVRNLIALWTHKPEIRYSLFKGILSIAMGASPKYETLIDMNFIGHLLRRLSFREAKQLCQQMKTNRLQKFDYGPVRNRLIYKQSTPPVYDLSNLKIRDWIIVSAANDALSTPKVVDHLISIVNPKPIARIEAPGFNHVDLFAGWENDKYVNLPILRYYQQMSYDKVAPNGGKRLSSRARGLDLSTLFPPEMAPAKIMETGQDVGKRISMSAVSAPLSIDARSLIEEFGKNMRQFFSTFGDSISSIVPIAQKAPVEKQAQANETTKSTHETSGSQNKYGLDVAEPKSTLSRSGNEPKSDNLNPIAAGMQNLIKETNKLSTGFGNMINPSSMVQNFGNISQLFRLPNVGQQKQSEEQRASKSNA